MSHPRPSVSLLFHHNTLTNKLLWQYFSLVCQLPPSIHPSTPPLFPHWRLPSLGPCYACWSAVSEWAASHQYGWVTEVMGSNAVHRFTPTLAVPLPEQIKCVGVSERESVCVGTDTYVWLYGMCVFLLCYVFVLAGVYVCFGRYMCHLTVYFFWFACLHTLPLHWGFRSLSWAFCQPT